MKRSAEELMAQLAEMTALMKDTEAIIESLKDELKMLMVENGLVEITNEAGKVTYHSVESRRFDQASFRRDFGDLFDSYTVTTSYQRFTFNI